MNNNFIFSFFCTEWIVAEANSQVQYFTHEKGAVGSRVKLQMGFSKVNITLKALDEELFPNRYWNERIAINSADDDFQGLMRDGVPVSIYKNSKILNRAMKNMPKGLDIS